VLIVGNSVSQSPAPGVDAYPERLRALLGDGWDVTSVIRSGATIEEMEPEVLAALRIQPDVVVLQVGINECAPRPLAPPARERLGMLRPLWLRHAIIRMVHRWRAQIIRWRPLAQVVPFDRFAASVGRIARAVRSGGARLIVLPITEITAAAEQRTPFTNREVARYNGALRALAGDGVAWIDRETLWPGLAPADYCYAPETVHWSAAAHRRVAEYLGRSVESAVGSVTS